MASSEQYGNVDVCEARHVSNGLPCCRRRAEYMCEGGDLFCGLHSCEKCKLMADESVLNGGADGDR